MLPCLENSFEILSLTVPSSSRDDNVNSGFGVRISPAWSPLPASCAGLIRIRTRVRRWLTQSLVEIPLCDCAKEFWLCLQTSGWLLAHFPLGSSLTCVPVAFPTGSRASSRCPCLCPCCSCHRNRSPTRFSLDLTEDPDDSLSSGLRFCDEVIDVLHDRVQFHRHWPTWVPASPTISCETVCASPGILFHPVHIRFQ